MSATLALQTALIEALRADAALTALLGGAAVHDGAPQGVAFPHVSLADVTARDYSDTSGAGEEHVFTFLVWSRGGGRSETLQILGAMVAVLDLATPALSGQALVNLSVERTETRRQGDGKTWRGLLRVRAVTEAA